MSIPFITGSWVNARGQKLHTLSIAPAQPVAVLAWHSGYAEHCERYRRVFSALAQQGIAVHSYDPHAHGRSEPSAANDKVYIQSFDHLIDDYAAYIMEMRKQYATSLPLFVGGHSMGGLVSIYTVLRDQGLYQGLILSSPALYVQLNTVQRIQVAICGMVAAVAPRQRLAPQIQLTELTDDPIALKERQEDLLCDGGNLRAATATTMLQAMQQIDKLEPQLKLPLLQFIAEDDAVCDVKGARRLHAVCDSKDKTLEVLPSGRHELLLHTVHGVRLTKMMTEWIKDRLPKGHGKL